MTELISNFFDYNRLEKAVDIPIPVSLLILAGALGVWYLIFHNRKQLQENAKLRNRFRWTLIAVIFICEFISKTMHFVYHDINSIRSLPLPFHICGVLFFMNIFYLTTENKFVHKIAFFPAIGATLIPLVLSDVRFPASEYMFYEFFISHLASGLAAIFFMSAYKSYPTTKTTIISGIWVMGWGLLMIPVNLTLKTHYTYVGPYARESYGQLQMLGEWPVMLIPMAILAVIAFAIPTIFVYLIESGKISLKIDQNKNNSVTNKVTE